MPIYEFHCQKCNTDSEILVRSNKWRGTKCPRCGSTKLSKNLSVFASSIAGATAPSAGSCSTNGQGGGGGACGCCGGGRKHKH